MTFNRSELVRSLLPAVVNVTIRREVAVETAAANAASGPNPQANAVSKQFQGSGFIIAAEGLIVTNYHVVDRAFEISVTFADGTKLPASLFKAARVADLALIRVQAGHPLPTTRWGDSKKLQVGDPVLAVGNPLGVGQSVTAGIVSALNRDIMDSPYDQFIQTDAAINHGNSGGPLFNMEGEVVGVDTALISPTTGSTGLGFAIPSNEARFIIDRLLTYGWVRPGWIGVKVQQLTLDMAQALGMAQPEGDIVAHLAPGGPAAKAGVQLGDVILRFNGKTPPDERALLREIAETIGGTQTSVDIIRGGQAMSLPITVEDWPRMQWEERDAPTLGQRPKRVIPEDLGLSFGPLTDASRALFPAGDKPAGLVITAVAPQTDAADRGLAPGDVLLRIHDKDVASREEVLSALEAARAEQRSFVLALVIPTEQSTPGPKWFALRLNSE